MEKSLKPKLCTVRVFFFQIAAACFSIYAFQELKKELCDIEELRFIFNSPAFTTEKAKKEKREFYIPRLNRERSLYGTEFEVRFYEKC